MISVNKRRLLSCVLYNIVISSAIVIFIKYTGGHIEGFLHNLNVVLETPSFYILVFVLGPNNAVHFTKYSTYLLLDFVFYLLVIAVVQVIYFKIKLNKIKR